MRRKRRPLAAPLPQRDGIDPVRVALPTDGTWPTVRDFLVERLPVGAGVVDAMVRDGRFVDSNRAPVTPATPYLPGASFWFHRDHPPEAPVPFALDVVHRDEHIVVVDKPHFLATMPRGSHVTQTALARLRTELGIPTLGVAHRLDRLTAGLLLCTVRPEERGAYQTLFSDRRVHKEYEAIAPYDPDVPLPRTVRSHIVKERGIIAAYEVAGAEPNSESRIELVEHRPTRHPHHPEYPHHLGRYRLTPHTGRTHQLRVHMSTLGLAILGDPVYPVVAEPTAPDDFRRPLQLLAKVLEFTDPVTGVAHRFVSGRTLEAWSAYDDWAR
ncbi:MULTISPECIES: pseudouridine synthase [unclassified Streptomyces]|uniref:pseudouridine synthase n=1 Tax=unclassified Streptomyces TaxID=2593676 RepID=UPI0033E55BFC